LDENGRRLYLARTYRASPQIEGRKHSYNEIDLSSAEVPYQSTSTPPSP
jgi:hypothetical protein